MRDPQVQPPAPREKVTQLFAPGLGSHSLTHVNPECVLSPANRTPLEFKVPGSSVSVSIPGWVVVLLLSVQSFPGDTGRSCTALCWTFLHGLWLRFAGLVPAVGASNDCALQKTRFPSGEGKNLC